MSKEKSKISKKVLAIIGVIAMVLGIFGYFNIGPSDKDRTKTLQNTEQIIKLLEEKGYSATPQLVNELRNKIDDLETELEERSRTTKDKRADEALAAFKEGNYEKARKLFEALQEEGETELAETAYNLGNVYFIELNFPKALDAYMDAVRLAPDNSIYLNEAGKTF